jgi:acetyl-CoA carboxylase carboxyltransferase component
MVEDTTMFITGPRVVTEVTGERLTAEELGGARVHQSNGVAHFVAVDSLHAALLTRELLSYLPQSALEQPVRAEPRQANTENPGAPVPRETWRVYDVRDVLVGLVDAAAFLEVAPKWARNLVTGFARIHGRPVGVIANQPRHRGGVLDVASAGKGAWFVNICNAYNLPLVVLVDTPGFMPGHRQESAGVIRHGAELLHAFARATVPKVTIVLRQAYGGGYIAMNSKGLGADFTFAWPRAKIGIMGPRQAVGIIHRRGIAADADPERARERLGALYAEEHLAAEVSAREGVIDDVILPSETRRRLCAALAALPCGTAGKAAGGPNSLR